MIFAETTGRIQMRSNGLVFFRIHRMGLANDI